jgi:hypothetical protein
LTMGGSRGKKGALAANDGEEGASSRRHREEGSERRPIERWLTLLGRATAPCLACAGAYPPPTHCC